MPQAEEIGSLRLRLSFFRSEMCEPSENSGDCRKSKKSLSIVPLIEPLASSAICTPSWMKPAAAMESFSLNPLVVIAGVPMRMPPGTKRRAGNRRKNYKLITWH
eukprot:TRINITY_DN22996_c0_g1_i1.p2 TRINITY_DN22996_c0_g1~~TRINITY_DN22996_c0_g1_i1.p2  ORF type:complete len:104 (-),score=18.15 TRINITY_DN22996_c0_g1_i1:526-837(-)